MSSDFCFEIKHRKDEIKTEVTFSNGGTTTFLCKVCLSYLKKGKLPPKAAANCLEVLPVPENVRLRSYLEEALIARILLFIKIFALRTSLMPAMKDKIIVIPLDAQDVLNNVESLPRLPSESGIIDIQWKRRETQTNAHLQAKVDPIRLFNALEFLKLSGNKYYQTTQNKVDYEARCCTDDPDGYKLLYGDKQLQGKILRLEFYPDGASKIFVYEGRTRDGRQL